ncbi:MAG: sugar ABC transporter substrate-binding protein [Anaerolineae bacterium]
MPSNKSRFAVVILSLILMLVATQCGGGAASTAQAPAQAPASGQQASATQAPSGGQAASQGASKDQVELHVAWWGSQDRHDRTIKAIQLFEQKHPNIKVTYEFSSFNDYLTKLSTQAAGGALPDVMQMDYAWIAEWAQRGLLVPLDDYTKNGSINVADVDPSNLNGGKVDGKLVAVNLGSNSQNWVLDADAFKKAGIDLPKDDWTWADFEKIAMALHEKQGNWAHGMAIADNQLWKSLYLSEGAWAFAKDGTQLGYTDDKPLVDWLNMILRLQKAGAVMPHQEELASYANASPEQSPTVSSKADMEYFWSNQITAFAKAAGDNRNFVQVPLPRPAGGKSANYIKPSQFFSISTQSKHPQEAAAFIDFFTNDIEANQILGAERGVPISNKVRDAIKPQMGKSQQAMFDYVARVSKDAQPVPPADPPGATDVINNVYKPLIDQVLLDQLAPDQAAKQLRDQANTILAKNKK